MRINAVTVNHNTSRFTELMIRSLLKMNDLLSLPLNLTVLDNKSDDKYLDVLLNFLKSNNIHLQQTGFDNSIDVEKHGIALEEYVKNNPDCDFYLFLDSDMWFIEERTIGTMLSELDSSSEDIFAVQARIYGHYAKEVIEGKNGKPGHTFKDKMTWSMKYDDKSYKVYVKDERCSPVCCLIRNVFPFRRIVNSTGLTPVQIFRVGSVNHYDTFGLMTHLMFSLGKKIYNFEENCKPLYRNILPK